MKFGDPNFLLSARVNENSKVLYNRNPRERVQKVAPWLTVDSDAYPAVVDGKILVGPRRLHDDRPLPAGGEGVAAGDDRRLAHPANDLRDVPTDQINYMRNAVKATVDAYDGTVQLYAWDTDDPMLRAWRWPSPAPCSEATRSPTELLSHLRYPEDLFKVQRYLFARYHVTDPATSTEGNDWWEVPEDPEPSRKPAAVPAVRRRTHERGADKFSLTSVYVPYNKNNLAAFISVDSDAAEPETYGQHPDPAAAQREHAGSRANRQRVAVRPDVAEALLPFDPGRAPR